MRVIMQLINDNSINQPDYMHLTMTHDSHQVTNMTHTTTTNTTIV